ncbi:MAG: FIST C-terminal domain-containing protein [Anaerolineae bacterium]|nr:FIST C-terminal domain-containing protein [Anaerolineae bacterium]
MPGAIFCHDADVPTLVKQIGQLPRSDGDTVLLLIAEHSAFDVPALLAALRAENIPVAGGVFPGVIYGESRYEKGLVADVLPIYAQTSRITGLNATSFDLTGLPEPPDRQCLTALVLVDGLTKHVALFLDHLFRRLANRVRYVGGGAGSLSFQQKPCVFDSDGMYQDAALVLWLKTKMALGVRHGWQTLRGPFIATQTEGTVVQQLSGQPAFKVYSEIIKNRTGRTLTRENFFEIAKGYPLGIFHARMDHIVRDPIAFTEDGSLVCVGEVPKHALTYILQGNRQKLVEHAHLATNEATRSAQPDQHNLIIDCISRVLYLEDDFGKELSAVRDALPEGAATPFGVLSLGEIATYKTGRVEFFNKTFVLGSLQAVS